MSFRYQSARVQNDQDGSKELILNPRQLAVLSQTATHGVTDKYKQVSTLDVLNQLKTESGFLVKSVSVSGTRKGSKEGFQKHCVTLGRPDLILKNVGDSRPEITIVNSHDGLKSFEVFLTVLRLVCTNGLKAPTVIAGARLRHVGGDLIPRVFGAVDSITAALPDVSNWIADLNRTILSQDEQIQFATRAIQLLDLPQTETVSTQVDIRSALRARRVADQGDSLWVTYNRLQENFLQGGVKYRTETIDANGLKSSRNNSTRHVQSIDTQIRLNSGLADLTKEFVKAA